jgi:hypothetical protein
MCRLRIIIIRGISIDRINAAMDIERTIPTIKITIIIDINMDMRVNRVIRMNILIREEIIMIDFINNYDYLSIF